MSKLEILFQLISAHVFQRTGEQLITGLKSVRERLELCPSSSKYHGAHPGGLLCHTIEVMRMALEINRLAGCACHPAQVAFCAAVHDLGKLGEIDKPLYLVNPDESKRDTAPYITNDKLADMPHELRTFYWLSIFGISPHPQEYQAIFYHAGMYMPGYKESIRRPDPLTHIIHLADMTASQLNGI